MVSYFISKRLFFRNQFSGFIYLYGIEIGGGVLLFGCAEFRRIGMQISDEKASDGSLEEQIL